MARAIVSVAVLLLVMAVPVGAQQREAFTSAPASGGEAAAAQDGPPFSYIRVVVRALIDWWPNGDAPNTALEEALQQMLVDQAEHRARMEALLESQNDALSELVDGLNDANERLAVIEDRLR